VAETEKVKGICFSCSSFNQLAFLPSGDTAMTRRSKKFSSKCGVLQEWNQRRKRYERKGQYVEHQAIVKAREQCEVDKGVREAKNKKAAIKRIEVDKIYVQNFALAIRKEYPYCPKNKEIKEMIDLAVEAHVRHSETDYDNQFANGDSKKAIRSRVKNDVNRVLDKWRTKP